MATHFESIYPHITLFIQQHGWIEMGYDTDSPLTSFLRAVDIGGMVWEGEDDYDSIDAALSELNAFLKTVASRPQLNARQEAVSEFAVK